MTSVPHERFSARSGSWLIVSPRYSAWAIALSVSLAVLLSPMAKAQGNHKASASDISQVVPHVGLNTATIKLPIIDGTDVRFTSLSTGEGLSQRKVSLVVQDDQGFLWFATLYGLNRYDGYHIKIFAHDPGNPNSLSGVAVSALFKARDGALWIGCDQFLNKLDPTTETFKHYPVPYVTHISQDAAGMLWLATARRTIQFESGNRTNLPLCPRSGQPMEPKQQSRNI